MPFRANVKKKTLQIVQFLFLALSFFPTMGFAQELPRDCVTKAQFLSGSYDNKAQACDEKLSTVVRYCGQLHEPAQRFKTWQSSQFGEYFVFEWPKDTFSKTIFADALRVKILLDEQLSDDVGIYFFVLASGIFSTSLVELFGADGTIKYNFERNFINTLTNPEIYSKYFYRPLPTSSKVFIRHLECAVSCGSNEIKMPLLVRSPVYKQCLEDIQ